LYRIPGFVFNHFFHSLEKPSAYRGFFVPFKERIFPGWGIAYFLKVLNPGNLGEDCRLGRTKVRRLEVVSLGFGRGNLMSSLIN